MELFSLENLNLSGNFSQFESKVFDRLKAEYIALLDGHDYKYYEEKKDLRRQGELNLKMKQIEDFYSNPQKRKEVIRENLGQQIEMAEEVMGEKNVFGPEKVIQVFGFCPEDVPLIPFSATELERAKELGQFLILRVDQAPDGKPLTGEKMYDLVASKFKQRNKDVLAAGSMFSENKFYRTDVPQLRWALVSTENIPNSSSKNYIQQTQELKHYLVEKVFKDQTVLPLEYQDAITELDNFYKRHFLGKDDERLVMQINRDWAVYAREFTALKINQLLRQTPPEVFYDFLVYLEFNGQLLEKSFTWTNYCSESGKIVKLGNSSPKTFFGFLDNGLHSGKQQPAFSQPDLGVTFSRSL